MDDLPVMPADLLAPLEASPRALALFESLGPVQKADYIRWIETCPNVAARHRRIRLLAQGLATRGSSEPML